MKTRLEECREMSDKDLVQANRDHPLAPLMPCLTALLERVEVKPESETTDTP